MDRINLLLLSALLLADRTWQATKSQQRAADDAADVAASKQLKQGVPYYFQAERLMQREPAQSVSAASSQSDRNSQKGAIRHIRVVTVMSPPFMMKRATPTVGGVVADANKEGRPPSGNNKSAAKQPVEWYGYCMDFFLELLKYLPYEVSYEIYEAPDRKFGAKTREIIFDHKNNKSQPVRRERWNGMIGELAQGRAHLALAPLSVMAERELVVDFTVPFYDLVGIQILLKRPEVPRDWFKFLTVLDNEVWLSITLAYFVTSLIIYLFDRLSPYSHKNMKRVERIRARRRERLAREAAVERGVDLATDFYTRARSAEGDAGKPSNLTLRPLSKQHENFTPAPSNVVYPLMPGDNIPAISGLVERGQQQDDGALVGDNPHGSTIHPESANKTKRRLSQDYLRSLKFRHHHQEGHPRAAADRAKQDGQLPPEGDDAELDSDSDQDNAVPDFNLRDSLWFCITSLTPQGGGEAPQNLSGRVVAGAWWLFCFIVIASYTANLAAFLTVSRLDIPIESLDDLAKQYRIKYAPIEGTAEQSFFERMAYIEEIFYNIWKEMSLNDSLSEEERSKFAVWDYPISDKYTKIWAQIQEVQMPTSLRQAVQRVKSSTLDDGFALLANANIIRYATMTDCSFRAVGEEFSRKPIALALQKNQESLRDDLSYAILQLINRRYMEVLREKWWTNNPERVVCDLNDESEGISIENIGGVFIIILAGVMLSFLVWAVERLLYKTKLDVSRELLEMGRDASTRKPSQQTGSFSVNK